MNWLTNYFEKINSGETNFDQSDKKETAFPTLHPKIYTLRWHLKYCLQYCT